MKELRVLTPCGMLGYGYPLDSFYKGIEQKPHAIAVDAGSTDAGPHKLGAGVAIVSPEACKKDLKPMIEKGLELKIPVIISSAGGSGAEIHVEWTYNIIKDVIAELGVSGVKILVIHADIPFQVIKGAIADGKVEPLGQTVPELTYEILEKTTRVVAQMGHEPLVKALEEGADIILCGRAYDPTPYAALAEFYGFDVAYGYHMGKILECAALCAVPGTTKDCVMGVLDESGFKIFPLSDDRRCTTLSVSAHTFYEKDHPYLLHGPGHILDLSQCVFKQIDEKTVHVSGSQMEMTPQYKIKLEGATKVAYRTFVVAGIRDPLLISKLKEVEQLVRAQVKNYYSEYSDFEIRFINYGLDGIMGELEPSKEVPHELGIIIDVLAQSQHISDAICATARSTMLHYGYEGRKSTAGNLAFPFAPSDVSFGAVYEFSVYHLMEVDNPTELFPIEKRVI